MLSSNGVKVVCELGNYLDPWEDLIESFGSLSLIYHTEGEMFKRISSQRKDFEIQVPTTD